MVTQGLKIKARDENRSFRTFAWDKVCAGIYRMRTIIGADQYAILRTRDLILTIYGCGHQLEIHAYNLSRHHSVDERDLILNEVVMAVAVPGVALVLIGVRAVFLRDRCGVVKARQRVVPAA